MSTFNLKRFSKPEVLKNMRPEVLLEFLSPYLDYFAGRDFKLPNPGDEGLLDYERLARILVDSTAETPLDLVNALYLINELSCPEGQEALEGRPEFAGLFGELGPQATPADVTVQCWLHDPKAVEQAFAETRVHQPRSFEHSQCRSWPPLRLMWTSEIQQSLETALGEWFGKRRRGRGVRVLFVDRDDQVWFVVRHGDPFRREGVLEQGESKSVLFRPEKYDVLVYNRQSGELRINARSKGEKDLYRTAFGEHLFGHRGYFGDAGNLTLEPLRLNGSASLACSDIEGLEQVVLTELTIFRGGAQRELEIRRANDVMAVYESRKRKLPRKGQLQRAKFQMKFADGGRPRAVTVTLPNRTQLTRDGDGALVEEWLVRRGFACLREGAMLEEA